MLTKDNAADKEQMYRVMCFNCLTHNRDDHTKNFSFLYTKENCFHVMNWFDKTSTDFTTGMCNMFMNNQGMFMWIRFADVEMLRNMDIDFGIIPVPKWDEPQEQYYSAVNQHMGTATVIPVSCESVDMEGYFLEVLCCESMKKLIPAYYDVTLQGKVT